MKTTKNKIKSQARLSAIAKGLKKNKKKIVFTNGCFDILHKGHVKLLEKAKSLGDVLIVAINTDLSVKKNKGPGRPINSENDRALVLASLEAVDYVTLFREDTPEKIIKKLCPNVLVKGGDWGKKYIVGGDYVLSKGGAVHSLPFLTGYSTTKCVKKIFNI